MRIEALPPLHLRQHVASIIRTRPAEQTAGLSKAGRKQKRGRTTRSVDDSMTYLYDVLDSPRYDQIEELANDTTIERNLDTPKNTPTEQATPQTTETNGPDPNIKTANTTKTGLDTPQNTENNTGPDYDPELDMADARHKEAHQDITESHITPTPVVSPLTRATATKEISPHLLFLQNTIQRQRISDDRFSYMTLIEAILFYFLLYETPKTGFHIKFGTYKLLRKKKELHSLLVFHRKKKIFAKYKLVFDIKESAYTIFDVLKKQTIGHVKYNVVDRMMEDAKGQIYHKPIKLDPVWDDNGTHKIRYQDIQIGDYHLDLTAVSKDHRKGQWQGPLHTRPIPFDVLYTSMDYNKHHIRTKKTITMNRHKLSLTLKFFDDAFTEPYAATGRCV